MSTAPPRLGAVLLAAGSGSRLGHRPKCLLELDGVPLVRRTLAALAAAGVDEIVVVTGHHAEQVEPVLQGLKVGCVRNPAPDTGQTSSQRLGLAALGAKLDAVLVALADQPLLDAQDIRDLIQAWTQRPAGIAVVHPQVNGQRGNPVILSAAVRAEVLAGAADFGARQWQGAHPERVHPFVTSNRHYRTDIDTPEDLESFGRETGLVLRWPLQAQGDQ